MTRLMATIKNQRWPIFGLMTLMLLGLSACTTTNNKQSGGTSNGQTEPAKVPYSLTLKQLGGADFPGLHSMIYALSDGELVLMAGRRNGMHGFPAQNEAFSNPSFPADQKNDTAFVIELATGKVLAQASVNDLPSEVVQQLTATNTQFKLLAGEDAQGNRVYSQDVLYVVGGYGYTDGGSMVTLQQAMAIKVQALIAAIKANTLNADFAKDNIYVGTHPALAITGGELEYSNDFEIQPSNNFWLIFGHQFDGVYSSGGGTYTQNYSESVRMFNLTPGQSGTALGKAVGALSVQYNGKVPDTSRTGPAPDQTQYHRRDLSIIKTLSPTGVKQITAFGGVFVPGKMEGFVNPIYITPAGTRTAPSVKLEVDTTITQLMAQYKAGTVPVYSELNNVMYGSIFAGISQYYWQDGKLKRDTPNFNITPPVDGLPFINTVSTMRIDKSGGQQYLHNGQYFPPTDSQPVCGTDKVKAPYLGSDTIFVATDSDFYQYGSVMLDRLTEPTVVGYLVGGIAATAPYPGKKTCASPTYFEVTLHPSVATSTTLLTLPEN